MTPYQRIMAAAKLGRGVRLTAEEVRQMSRDSAILQLAELDDEACARMADDAKGEQ